MKTSKNVQKIGFPAKVFFTFALFTALSVSAQEYYAGNPVAQSSENAGIKTLSNPMPTKSGLYAAALAALTPATEEKMEIEGWMVDEKIFSPEEELKAKTGKEKEVEIWKVRDEKYGNRIFILSQVKDRKLEIEKWMLDNYYWQMIRKR